MAVCECLGDCAFFDRMGNMPVTAQLTKEQYCLKDNSRCARYRIFAVLGPEHVPADLFPSEGYLAEGLLTGSA